MEEGKLKDDDVLIEEPFFESIDKLDEETILNDEIFTKYIFCIESIGKREKEILKLQKKAKQLGVKSAFDDILKQFKREYLKEIKEKDRRQKYNMQNEENTTDFSKCIDKTEKGNVFRQLKLNCGKWIANEEGVYKIEYNYGQAIKVKASPIPIVPVERYKNIETNEEKVKLAFFKDNYWQEIIVEKNTIISKAKILQLGNKGLEVNENNAKDLITYLSDILILNKFATKKIVSHLGWFKNEFVPYSEKYMIEPFENLKDERNIMLNNIATSGDYEKWKKVAKEVRKNKIVKVMMDTCFASILIPIFGINNFMTYFWVKSGSGKSVATLVNASIFGQPDIYTKNFNDTAYSAELMCSFLGNLPFIIDELELEKKKDSKSMSTEEFVYMILQGRGKNRGNGKGGLTNVGRWQNTITLNGEESIVDKFKRDGAINRVIELKYNNRLIEKGKGADICDTVRQNYGWAGKDFIKIIQRKLNNENEKKQLFEMQKDFFKELNEMSVFEKQVNSISLILTAGNIVAKEIFKDEALTANDVKEFFRDVKEEEDRAYELILEWFHQNINKFKNNIETGDVWGKYLSDNDGNVTAIFINPKVLKDFLKTQEYSWNVLKERMFEKGYIEKDTRGQYTINQKVNGIQGRYIKFLIDNERFYIQNENNYKEKQMNIPF